MNNKKAASTESATPGEKKQRRYLSAEKKFQIYLETQRPDQPVGEVLRRESMFSTDLARIRQQVREATSLFWQNHGILQPSNASESSDRGGIPERKAAYLC